MDNESTEVQLVVFKLAEEEYAVKIGQVKEIINLAEVTSLPQAHLSVEGVINLRGKIIPIFNLKKRLELANQQYSSQARVMVVEVDSQLLGIKVDEAVEVLRLDTNAIQALPRLVSQVENQSFVVGVGKLEERLIVILDLTKVLSNEEIQEIKKGVKELKV